MNVTFYIEDNKYKGNLTRKQILEAVNPVTQFNFRPDYEYLNHFLMQKMNENNSILLGQENFSARVFELSFNAEKNSYCISVPLPCSYADFTVVFDFIKKLCAFLENNKVITGDGKEYTTDKDNFKAVFDFFNIVSAKLLLPIDSLCHPTRQAVLLGGHNPLRGHGCVRFVRLF